MRASRGMGDINPNKMPKARTTVKKDGGEPVKLYAKGGMAKGNWIKNAVKKPGALRASLGVKKGQNIPAGKLAKAAKAPGKLGQRARLAQTFRKMGK